jgi:hypothetical protein
MALLYVQITITNATPVFWCDRDNLQLVAGLMFIDITVTPLAVVTS